MARSLAEIEQDVRMLDIRQKTQLIQSLIAEIDGAGDLDSDRAWLAEVSRRHSELASGAVRPVPLDEVARNVRDRLTNVG